MRTGPPQPQLVRQRGQQQAPMALQHTPAWVVPAQTVSRPARRRMGWDTQVAWASRRWCMATRLGTAQVRVTQTPAFQHL